MELVCVILILLPVALFVLNISYFCIASYLNDAACREAARAASEQSTLELATAAANAAVQAFQIAGKAPTVSGVYLGPPPDPEADPPEPTEITGIVPNTEGLQQAPFARVKTRFVVQSPFPVFIGEGGLAASVNLVSACAFPALNGVIEGGEDIEETEPDPTDTEDIDPNDPADEPDEPPPPPPEPVPAG